MTLFKLSGERSHIRKRELNEMIMNTEENTEENRVIYYEKQRSIRCNLKRLTQ